MRSSPQSEHSLKPQHGLQFELMCLQFARVIASSERALQPHASFCSVTNRFWAALKGGILIR